MHTSHGTRNASCSQRRLTRRDLLRTRPTVSIGAYMLLVCVFVCVWVCMVVCVRMIAAHKADS